MTKCDTFVTEERIISLFYHTLCKIKLVTNYIDKKPEDGLKNKTKQNKNKTKKNNNNKKQTNKKLSKTHPLRTNDSNIIIMNLHRVFS